MELPAYLRKPLKHSLSAIRPRQYEEIKRKWVATWTDSPRYRCLQLQDTLTPYSQKYLKYIANPDLSRVNASRIFQLRVGHVPLNQYLLRFKKVDNPCCPACSHPKETVEHFLLYCPKYAHERWPILNQNQGSAPKPIKILTSDKLLLPLANYLDATGRFHTTITIRPVSNTT